MENMALIKLGDKVIRPLLLHNFISKDSLSRYEDVFGEVDVDAVGAARAVWAGHILDVDKLVVGFLVECSWVEEDRVDRAECKCVVVFCYLTCVAGDGEKCWWWCWGAESVSVAGFTLRRRRDVNMVVL